MSRKFKNLGDVKEFWNQPKSEKTSNGYLLIIIVALTIGIAFQFGIKWGTMSFIVMFIVLQICLRKKYR